MQENNSNTFEDELLPLKSSEKGFSDKLFSDEITTISQWINIAIFCQAVVIFGLISNVINIVCFVKQGFVDPVNISFLGLALSDFGSLITLMWSNVCLTPSFAAADLPFDPTEIQYLMSSMPHYTFLRVSSCITALITTERCLCIIAPMKIRSMVTSKKVATIIISIYVIIIANSAPIYAVNSLDLKFYPHKNKSLIGMVSTRNKEIVESVAYIINTVFISFGTFMIIIICTIILVIQLHNKTKWRKKSTISTQADNVSTRNQKVAKMVVMVSALFISCNIPQCAAFIAMSLEPDLYIGGKYRNTLLIFGGFCMVLDSVNASANIFIYYDMSSKYKSVIRQMFNIGSKN